ncbi:radical SAM protein [Desulfovibrio sp. OttesenSCG-928-G15]|nr:radical SAM protein [Desulfovibrio sp. OttesenSCG-928-G15]
MSLANDPFASPLLKGPGVWRSLRETFGGARRLLDVIQMEVTSLCPGKCAYCPHTTMGDQWKARHMAPETFVRLWPLLLQCSRVHLQGWGEPFLHPRFIDMARLARRADCMVSTTTCGLVMNEKLAASIVDSGIDILAFSLTGASRQSNNSARAGVDFDRVLENITLLQDIRKKKMGVHLEVHFAYLMLAGAVEEVRLLPELMRETGVHAAVVSTLDYIAEPAWEKEAFLPHETAKIAQTRAVLEETARTARQMGLALYYSLPKTSPRRECLENPARSVYVDAEGNLSPCIYVNLPTHEEQPDRRVFGNAQHDDPLAVLAGEDFTNFRKALATQSPDTPCINCPKRFAEGNRSEG